jgi:hypothetical protein
MKKKYIIFIDRGKLRNKLHAELLRSIVAYLQGKVDIKYIEELLKQLAKLVTEEEEILILVSRYDATGPIHEDDHRRDSSFYGTREIIRTFFRHFDENKRAAAVRLDAVFEDYKTAPHQALPEESNAIGNLLLRLEKYQDDINLLGLVDWISEMKQANDSVRLLTVARESEAAARAQSKMKAIRTETDRVCSEIFNRLEAIAILEGVEAYQEVFNEINARITEYNTILAREKGRRNSKKENAGKSEVAES